MIKKEWMWMLTLPKKTIDDDDAYIDGVDERPTPKDKPYNDDDYDN
tara:strand:+ start:72 stop:209 length:138 start_codon:yes stop_codon:yes gene_type:complete